MKKADTVLNNESGTSKLHIKPYGTGLLMGVFDLFHIGHLNLIRRAKAQCCYLRIGVLSDKLGYEFKKIYPAIPQEERM